MLHIHTYSTLLNTTVLLLALAVQEILLSCYYRAASCTRLVPSTLHSSFLCCYVLETHSHLVHHVHSVAFFFFYVLYVVFLVMVWGSLVLCMCVSHLWCPSFFYYLYLKFFCEVSFLGIFMPHNCSAFVLRDVS